MTDYPGANTALPSHSQLLLTQKPKWEKPTKTTLFVTIRLCLRTLFGQCALRVAIATEGM
jgi:hypothetical protein